MLSIVSNHMELSKKSRGGGDMALTKATASDSVSSGYAWDLLPEGFGFTAAYVISGFFTSRKKKKWIPHILEIHLED